MIRLHHCASEHQGLTFSCLYHDGKLAKKKGAGEALVVSPRSAQVSAEKAAAGWEIAADRDFPVKPDPRSPNVLASRLKTLPEH
jgi:hypothetical protein